MKNPRRHAPARQSATSLPLAPADDAGARVRTYLLTMGIRIACLVLMVVITPYGWYSFVFALGAVLLPYFAVVIANAASGRAVTVREDPGVALDAARPREPEPQAPEAPLVIRIAESPAPAAPDRPRGDGAGDAARDRPARDADDDPDVPGRDRG